MNSLRDTSDRMLAKRIVLIFLGFFLVQLILGSFLINQVAVLQTSNSLRQIANRVKGDITYQNGTWGIDRYNADPNVPDTYPLYLLSSDGFVIDRWKPLHGFLDTSDVKRLLSYKIPQTITTPTDQAWRIFSRPISKDGQTIGVITVSYFNPSTAEIASTDQKLLDAANIISSKIVVKQNSIDTTSVDARDVSFDVAFQVVDNFNRIVTKNNNTNSIDRIPNYIDASYVGSVVNETPERQIKDSVTGEKFLLITSPIVDRNNFIVGVLVVGKSIAYIGQIVRNFIIAECSLGFVLIVAATLVALKMLRPVINQAKLSVGIQEKKVIDHLSFDKKAGILMLDHEEIIIPYATNQYYLCVAVFGQPRKRWESDELLEKFGERDLTNARKVYDAMVMVNKKMAPVLDDRLVVMHEKTYQLNPVLLKKLI